jgi:PAS domain S-box-containing protein
MRALADLRFKSDLQRPAARRHPRARCPLRWPAWTVARSRGAGAVQDHAYDAAHSSKGLKSSVMFHLGRRRWKHADHRIGFAPDDGRRRELGRVRPSLSFALPVAPRLLACLAIIFLSVSSASSLAAPGPAASSSWMHNERMILVAIIVIAIESALIAALLVQFVRRRRAERALKESEERWRSVFETSAAGVAVLDKDARFLATNLAFQAMLGYSDKELRTASFVDLGFPDDRDALRRLGEELRSHPRHDAVTQFRRRDGSVMWSHIYFSSIVDDDSKPRLIIATALDITDHKAAEEAAHTAQSELAQVARLTAMGEMSASIAHEINQPLAAIVANGNAGLRWLANAAPDLDEVRATLKRIVSDGHRAGKVISGVRTLFKKNVQARGPIDVNDLAREVLSLVRGEFETRRVTVETELGQIPPVIADRAQLQQVFLNLITNALDAMGAINDRRRVLRLRSERCEPGKVMVTVHDSGPGIEKKNIHRIFEPFFTTKLNGTGMGLSICRSVVESHGGHLMASHGHPHGAVFQIILPIQEADPASPASANGQRSAEMVRR